MEDCHWTALTRAELSKYITPVYHAFSVHTTDGVHLLGNQLAHETHVLLFIWAGFCGSWAHDVTRVRLLHRPVLSLRCQLPKYIPALGKSVVYDLLDMEFYRDFLWHIVSVAAQTACPCVSSDSSFYLWRERGKCSGMLNHECMRKWHLLHFLQELPCWFSFCSSILLLRFL